MKKICSNVWDILKDICPRSLIWFGSIIYLEIIFDLLISKNFNWQLCINVLLITIMATKLVTFVVGLFNEKIECILTGVGLFLLGIIYSLQGVFYNIFHVYFSLYNLALQDQLNSFVGDALRFIYNNLIYIFIFMIPFILFLIFRKKIKKVFVKNNKNVNIYLIVSLIIWIIISQTYIFVTKDQRYSTYDLYHNVNNASLNVKRVGVMNNYKIEVIRLMFGFTPKKVEAVNIKEKIKDEEPEEIVYEPNILDLNLNDTGNGSIDVINAYMRNEEPTLKNKYTGMFEGYNLIYITAESFSEIAVDPGLTPTLYRLTHSGFIFNSFYTPNNLSTIGGEFQSLTGLYPDASILSRWRDGTNSFPYGLANVFKNVGYSTYAYHNNSYVFQDRNQYLASQGFDNFLACYNGLERRMNCGRWPQSDDDMIEVTVGDYIHNEGPFMAYYMTVSGHLGYTYMGNSIASQNREFVDGLDKNENAKAYIATQIELDKALNRLLNELEAAGKLDNTVIVLLADHYPYGLNIDTINSISSYTRDDIEINHNSLIIWNSKLEDTVIDKPCMSADVIPTVYNLFGINYDSRLFSGKDILSTSFGVAVMSDRSWVTSKGKYYAPGNHFYPYSEEPISEEYIDNVNSMVNSRLNISRMILENNYYWYIQ